MGATLTLDRVESAEEYREHPTRRLVELARSGSGERVELVEEEDCTPEGRAVLEESAQLLLALAIPLTHQPLERSKDER